ncbi:MAG: hypothetical protein DWQ34_25090 [Planctomycetota bacterium]|nr:MAG: hypothetical protein DWQ34_25090 [Planctomycetota bacterium]REK27346.1 MAG: hypothetical protein DWQ41_08265 [Planctomycetota bacterium]REK36632.1 MAG: hypothetical protein DWQ45_08365 [Planctomycetota bacterium]
MDSTYDNQTWIVEVGGDVVEKRADVGLDELSTIERLIYWLWWADYMMRNAGDFADAQSLEHDFQREVTVNAKQLGLSFTQESFSLSRADFQAEYFDRFDRICDEVRHA